MKTKMSKWMIAILFLLSISACGLPEVTPPTQEILQTPTASIQINPSPQKSTQTEVNPPVLITLSNCPQLVNTQKAAVSNIQKINWASDSQSLELITQNFDSSNNMVFGVTTLTASDLSTQSLFVSPSGRVVSITPDGLTAAVISADLQSFSLIDLSLENKPIFTHTTDFEIGNITFSPDLTYLAVTKAYSWEVVLFDLTSGAELRTLSGFETAAPVFDAGFSHSPQWIVWHARATIQLQEVESATMGAVFSHEDFVSAFTLSPDGSVLASSAAATIGDAYLPVALLWDTTSGAKIGTLQLDQPGNTLAFSPDGKMLAVGTGNDIQIWNPSAGKLLTTLSGHSDMVTQVAFSPDGKRIATSGIDNQLYLWQVIP